MPANDSKALAREQTRHWLSDQEQCDELLEALANGTRLNRLCREYDLVYAVTVAFLVKRYPEQYEAAKLARAEAALDEIADIEDDLEAERLDFNSARELIKSKQWRAERLNSGRYGQKQQLDVRTTDMTQLHMQAIRELSSTRLLPEPRPAAALPAPSALPVIDVEGVPVDKA